jgi:hypothetical protein
MPTASNPVPPDPGPNVPFVDPKTGRISRPWYDWISAIAEIVKKLRTEIP